MDRHKPPGVRPGNKVPKETLTQTFNRNARGKTNDHTPVKTFKAQISELRAMMSQPKPGRDLRPKHARGNSPNPKRDKLLLKNINTILKTVQAQRAKIKQDFAKASIKGTAKHSFNRSARRM